MRDVEVLERVLFGPEQDVRLTRLWRSGGDLGSLVSEVGSIIHHRVRRFDVNIHVEDIKARWFKCAHTNVWMPNQEWVRPRSVESMRNVDNAFCKTIAGMEALESQGVRSTFVGFSSPDRYDPTVKRAERALHIAGLSPNKGTLAVLEAWREHPDWPVLDLVWSVPSTATLSLPVNVRLYSTPVPEKHLQYLLNRASYHICPSSVEGFGHTLVEGMSCGACVVTTDGPPMNELVNNDRGVLVPWARKEPLGFATAYHVDKHTLAQGVHAALGLSTNERTAMGQSARLWYQVNDRAFQDRITKALADLAN